MSKMSKQKIAEFLEILGEQIITYEGEEPEVVYGYSNNTEYTELEGRDRPLTRIVQTIEVSIQLEHHIDRRRLLFGGDVE